MSTGPLQRTRSASRSSKRSQTSIPPPPPSITPKNEQATWEPCAATASFFIYAQRNLILCLHHDTLAIERRFGGHREDVSWISVDNVSERGAGRLVVSYDAGNTAICWDLMTGEEVARFASYEQIRVASWMRNGNVAFGNAQGNVILFEPSTSEHISARTIFDPVTALAPVADCRTFAIGYQNGSILIATLQPTFTILHTLTSTRAPSPIAGLAWHGSSSRQKSEMLATQTLDGDLRVWSIPKAAQGDSPCVIRVLGKTDIRDPGPVWFGWSKTGRILQVSEGQTYSWDVRTKRVTFEAVPTLEGFVGIANYGPTATLFTLGRNHTIQQYDINPQGTPMLVANVQHVPANTPPSPPNSIEEKKIESDVDRSASSTPALPIYSDTGESEEEGMVALSPLQKIAQEMDAFEDERRDHLGPLSPSSSRGSMSSRSSANSQRRRYRFEKASSVSSKDSGPESTVFSLGSSIRTGRESMSIRSLSSAASSAGHYKPSSHRREAPKRPPPENHSVDLFPFTKSRLSDVPFRSPQYSPQRTTDELRQQMLSVVFGWEDEVESLIRDELSRQQPGSASFVLLSKWLGELGADSLGSMIGTESMTSSDWMLLALSAMGQDSQKKVGQAFVQRLLEKGDVHPAAAILLGLGEQNDAIEVYVSRKYWMEAVLLTCLVYPNDWKRQSFLVRKWGESAVAHKQPELAVRCFSCTSLESAETWTSPTAQDAVFEAQAESAFHAQLSPPLSPPGAGMPSRLKNSSLKLITTFGDKHGMAGADEEQTPMNVGVTPIAQSALSPGGHGWTRSSRAHRDPSSARTATPGAYRRRRFPSRSDTERNQTVDEIPIIAPARRPTPQTAIPQTAIERKEDIFHRRNTSSGSSRQDPPLLLSAVAYDPTKAGSKATSVAPSISESLPSPAPGVFNRAVSESRSRNGSRSRKPEDLQLDLAGSIIREGIPSSRSIRPAVSPPPLTGASLTSLKSDKIRSIDEYISSLDEANHYAQQQQQQQQQQQRAESRRRHESRERKSRSRAPSETRSTGTGRIRYIKPAKRSPSSPVSMSPDDATLYSSNTESNNYQDERYYGVTSPTESRQGRTRSRSKTRERAASKLREKRAASKPPSRNASRTRSRQPSPEALRITTDRGRGLEPEGSYVRSPSSPLPMSTQVQFYREEEAAAKADAEIESKSRHRSRSRRPGERGSSARREKSPDRRIPRERSSSRRPAPIETFAQPVVQPGSRPVSPEMTKGSRRPSQAGLPRLNTDLVKGDLTTQAAILARKEAAARELEERRLSLARRPSAPIIPHPEEISRMSMSNRSVTDFGASPTSSFLPSTAYQDRIPRSQTVDPEALHRYTGAPRFTTGTSTPSTPIGLPATPRAMRHPRYMSADQGDRDIPAVPQIPARLSTMNSGQISRPRSPQEMEEPGPLLPATTYGQPANLPRSASAPPEPFYPPQRRGSVSSTGSHNRKQSGGSGNSHKRISPPFIASIAETLNTDQQVIVIEEGDLAPPLLPELQHLSGPPPPPPPPSMFQPVHKSSGSQGVINIAIEEESSRNAAPHVVEAPVAVSLSASPSMHRRGRGSVSDIGSRIRQVTERMRSTSRSRAKSPPQDFTPSPYESVVPPFNFVRRDSVSHGKSSSNENIQLPPPPPPPPTMPFNAEGQLMEQVISPIDDKRSPPLLASGYMRNPKEIRANMPPAQLQPGVSPPLEGGMI